MIQLQTKLKQVLDINVPYLLEYKTHFFQSFWRFKIEVRLAFECIFIFEWNNFILITLSFTAYSRKG